MNPVALACSALMSSISRISAPAQKCFSEVEMRIARTSSRASRARSASSISVQNCRSSEFSALARFSLRWPTPSTHSTAIDVIVLFLAVCGFGNCVRGYEWRQATLNCLMMFARPKSAF